MQGWWKADHNSQSEGDPMSETVMITHVETFGYRSLRQKLDAAGISD